MGGRDVHFRRPVVKIAQTQSMLTSELGQSVKLFDKVLIRLVIRKFAFDSSALDFTNSHSSLDEENLSSSHRHLSDQASSFARDHLYFYFA